MSDLISLHPRQGLVLPLSYASHFDRYTVTYLIIVLIYISLITNDVEYLFFWMFCESVSTLVNYGFNYFVHFYFVLLLCFDSLYIV